MRSAIFALLVLFSLAVGVYSQVNVPYTNCGQKGDHITVTNITANYWPPSKSAPLSISINGISDENITSGSYEIDVYWENTKIDVLDGSVCNLDACPITVGPASVVYNVTIPSVAPGGSYEIDIVANDQNKQELLCVKITFKLMMEQLANPTHFKHLPRFVHPQ